LSDDILVLHGCIGPFFSRLLLAVRIGRLVPPFDVVEMNLASHVRNALAEFLAQALLISYAGGWAGPSFVVRRVCKGVETFDPHSAGTAISSKSGLLGYS
jgi:hypothetical protein